MPILAFPNKFNGIGGPSSFQKRLIQELEKRNWEIAFPEKKTKPDIVLVIAGTIKLSWLLKMKLKGVPIIFRLDGLNWIEKYQGYGMKIRAINKFRNFLMIIIRQFFADVIVYQSRFVESWWNKKIGKVRKKSVVIWNSVDMQKFSPDNGGAEAQKDLLFVEGYIDYSPYAPELINFLHDNVTEKRKEMKTRVNGKFYDEKNKSTLNPTINHTPFVKNEEIQNAYKNGVHVSLDVNAACPNTVIEALACGIPVIGFDTGALKELVPDYAGIVVDYGGDPWKLDSPDFKKLADAADTVLSNWEYYSEGARKFAEEQFNILHMTEKYLE